MFSKNYNLYPYNLAYYNPQLTCTFPGLTPTTNTANMTAAATAAAMGTSSNHTSSTNSIVPLASYNSQHNQENHSQTLLKNTQLYPTLSTASNLNSSPSYANYSSLNDNKCKLFIIFVQELMPKSNSF